MPAGCWKSRTTVCLLSTKRKISRRQQKLPEVSFLSFTIPKYSEIRWTEVILQPFRCFTYVTAHSQTLPLLHPRHSSFSNPSVASSTSQLILQLFFRFSYVTGCSLTSPGDPHMVCILIIKLLPRKNAIRNNKQAYISVSNFYRRFKPSAITTTIKQRVIIQ